MQLDYLRDDLDEESHFDFLATVSKKKLDLPSMSFEAVDLFECNTQMFSTEQIERHKKA